MDSSPPGSQDLLQLSNGWHNTFALLPEKRTNLPAQGLGTGSNVSQHPPEGLSRGLWVHLGLSGLDLCTWEHFNSSLGSSLKTSCFYPPRKICPMKVVPSTKQNLLTVSSRRPWFSEKKDWGDLFWKSFRSNHLTTTMPLSCRSRESGFLEIAFFLLPSLYMRTSDRFWYLKF